MKRLDVNLALSELENNVSHYKDVNGERLLCWGRAGDTYTKYVDSYLGYETTDWFDAIRNAAEGSWRSEYPVKIREITYVRDYGVDQRKGVINVASVMCDDKYNITVVMENN